MDFQTPVPDWINFSLQFQSMLVFSEDLWVLAEFFLARPTEARR